MLPEIENGVLAGHHMIFLGERGQAKSRIIRSLADLLDEHVPAVKGCEINDDPYRADLPATAGGWRPRTATSSRSNGSGATRRYAEKLATPDVSVADLIGEIDPIKVAEGRYLADEETIHYGLIPRTNRGIFAINELPDLTEKVQVGLFNLMEEKDVQIKGYKIRLPLDLVFVASANPEDYTSRGTDHHAAEGPLRHPDSHALSASTIEDEIAIMEQESGYPPRVGMALRVPQFIKDIVAQITFEARASNEINQTLGRLGARDDQQFRIGDLQRREARGAQLGDNEIVPRLSDLHSLYASTAGKIELEYVGEDKKEEDLIERLINRAVLKVFDRYFKIDDLQHAWPPTSRADGASRSPTARRRPTTSTPCARCRACARRSSSSARSRRRA